MGNARQIAEQYQVILGLDAGHWYGRGLELPDVMADGRTADGCARAVREALTGAVAYLLERGDRPPTPARSGNRSQQVNVRLTTEEKLLLEQAARRKGFVGLSDFIRTVAVEASTT
ncbi:MAG: hypothetical protein K8T91_19750 [Planctomycetes bacterium]|nr:hypothetical protein [Planctomycetota bacterium]